jgi:hypothetical protein
MASKPKGKKGRVSYSDELQASVGMTDAGPSNEKDTMSSEVEMKREDANMSRDCMGPNWRIRKENTFHKSKRKLVNKH